MEAATPISKNYGKNLKKSINRTISSTPCENFAPINYQNGILQTPPILYHSLPPFLAHQKQAPLLPLPISKSNVHQHYNNHINTLSQNRTFSLPPTDRKFNKSKKSSPKPKSSKVVPLGTSDKIGMTEIKSSKVATISSTNPLGPDPKDLPKDVSMVLSMSSTTGGKEQSIVVLNSSYVENSTKCDGNKNQMNLLHMTSEKVQSVRGTLASSYVQNPMKNDANSSVLFTTVSPPPSSLPLPTFSLRPKLSCNAEASTGVDTGATDNLRRLLRLR